MSMFDEMVRALKIRPVEKDIIELIKSTRIFNFQEPVNFNIAAHRDQMSDEELKLAMYDFYAIGLSKDRLGLPFPNTCIVAEDAACLFAKITNNKDAYVFVVYTDVHLKVAVRAFYTGIIIIPDDVSSMANLKATSSYSCVLKGNKRLPTGEETKTGTKLITSTLTKALGLLMELNTPDRFILEVTPTKTDVRSDRYIPRSHQRPEYILLHPHVIRKYMKTEHEIIGHKKAGHERRAHNRTYSDDPIRWPKMHGQTIRIEAVWIGSTENIVGDRQYKVIL